MYDSCFTQFNPKRFGGLQFYAKHPCVVVLYRTGKYIVTGSPNEEDLIAVINCMDWSKYASVMRPGITQKEVKKRATRVAFKFFRASQKLQDHQVIFSDIVTRALRELDTCFIPHVPVAEFVWPLY